MRAKTKPTRARFTLTFTVDYERGLDSVPAKVPDTSVLLDLATKVLRATKSFDAIEDKGDIWIEPGARIAVALVRGKRIGGAR